MSRRRKPNSGDPRKRRGSQPEPPEQGEEEAIAAKYGRIAELATKYAEGRTDVPVQVMIDGMPDGADKDELLALSSSLTLSHEALQRALDG